MENADPLIDVEDVILWVRQTFPEEPDWSCRYFVLTKDEMATHYLSRVFFDDENTAMLFRLRFGI